ncbi:hypothetical protein AB1Y20_023560 [Prymnesium parvum]|uniref:ATP-dependent DNA helicase n=1 Tax=Prymnesium parvum TaxID=97485 RepID=A0AB34JEL5_PRYPA
MAYAVTSSSRHMMPSLHDGFAAAAQLAADAAATSSRPTLLRRFAEESTAQAWLSSQCSDSAEAVATAPLEAGRVPRPAPSALEEDDCLVCIAVHTPTHGHCFGIGAALERASPQWDDDWAEASWDDSPVCWRGRSSVRVQQPACACDGRSKACVQEEPASPSTIAREDSPSDIAEERTEEGESRGFGWQLAELEALRLGLQAAATLASDSRRVRVGGLSARTLRSLQGAPPKACGGGCCVTELLVEQRHVRRLLDGWGHCELHASLDEREAEACDGGERAEKAERAETVMLELETEARVEACKGAWLAPERDESRPRMSAQLLPAHPMVKAISSRHCPTPRPSVPAPPAPPLQSNTTATPPAPSLSMPPPPTPQPKPNHANQPTPPPPSPSPPAAREAAPACPPLASTTPMGVDARAEADVEAVGWACAKCTYIHEMPDEQLFVACLLCGFKRKMSKRKGAGAAAPKRRKSEKPPAAKKGKDAPAPRPADAARPLLPFEEQELLSQMRPDGVRVGLAAAAEGVVATAAAGWGESSSGMAPSCGGAAAAAVGVGRGGAAEELPHAAEVPVAPARVWTRDDLQEWLDAPEQAAIKLDKLQRRVIELTCRRGANVFYTGPGGVGKSFVTHVIVSFLRAVYGVAFEKAVAITAPTGIAATHIGGTTIHSAFGVGVPNFHSDFERRIGGQSGRAKRLAQQLRVILIDEVSMLAGEFLDLLDMAMRRIVARFGSGREKKHRGEKVDRIPAFGGVQVVCCGDFFQLPPIVGCVPQQTWARLDAASLKHHSAVMQTGIENKPEELFLNRGFAFQASAWWSASMIFVELTQVWRQSDPRFVGCLHRVRQGDMTAEDLTYLNEHCAPLPSHPSAAARPSSAAVPMLLAPFNAVVHERNVKELEEKLRQGCAWIAADWVDVDEDCGGRVEDVERRLMSSAAGSFFGDCMAEKRIELCEGARVILVYNVDLDASSEAKLCNGSLGVVAPPPTDEEVRLALDEKLAALDEIVKAALDQLRASDERARAALEKRVAFHRTYRARLQRWMRNDRSRGDHVARDGGCWGGAYQLPRVRFDNGRCLVVLPVLLQSDIVGQGSCYRLQLPLKPAWAITIHKSQGLTLDSATVQISGCFDAGMAYVSVSRVKSLAGLRFQRNCSRVLRCDGCAACRCPLTLADVHVNGDVKHYYRLANELDVAVAETVAQLRTVDSLAREADEIVRGGPRQIAELARAMSQRIDLPTPIKRLASALSAKAQALNPGLRDSPSQDKAAGGIRGWWTIAPKLESTRASRTAISS